MKKATLVIRILLGLMLILFGLNKFLNFMPLPPMPEAAQTFMMALVNSGYIMEIVAVVEIVTGVLILIDKYKSLALLILFPIILNAFLFHLFLDLPGIGGAFVALSMTIFLMFRSKDNYSAILKP